MDNFEEKACTCALNRIFGFTPRTGYALISHLGGASEVFRISREDLEAMLGRASRHIGQIGLEAVRQARQELKDLERLGIAELKNRGYTNISGGERQLVLIARAIAQQATECR